MENKKWRIEGRRWGVWIIIILTIVLFSSCKQKDKVEEWSVVSIPDFLNVDTEYPQKGWEDLLSCFLDSVKAENPDFVLVPGDMVMGRWDRGDSSVTYYADIYYPHWKARMEAHGLGFYVAVGDHELGDNPWRPDKAALVPEFKRAFQKHFNIPGNGPANMLGTTYYFTHKNCLFISVDVFEPDSTEGYAAKVSGKQIRWLENVFEKHKDIRHKVVMGHVPVITPVRKLTSSCITLREGKNSDFWKTLKRYDADLYLCGEVHDVTSHADSSIVQVAHGGLFGYNERVSYMVINFSENKIDLKIKELDITAEGEKMWQVGTNRPHEIIRIQEASKGFRRTGAMSIEKSGMEKKFTRMTGIFHPDSNTPGKIAEDQEKNNEYTWKRFNFRMK